MMNYVKANGILAGIFMFGNIYNKIKKALFESVEGNTDTKVDGGVNVDSNALYPDAEITSPKIRDRPNGMGIEYELKTGGEEGYSASDNEIDPCGTRNSKQW